MRRFVLGFGLALANIFPWQSCRAETPELPGSLIVPSYESMKRVDNHSQLLPEENATRSFVLKTTVHKPIGDAYVIVTDQSDESFLAPLRRLAAFHKGKLLRVNTFLTLCDDAAGRDDLRTQLLAEKPQYVVIAPKIESYQENVLLSFWDILSKLSPEPGLDVFPGIMAAPDADSLKSLVERSIAYRASAPKPFIISQVTDCGNNGQRALQKMRILRNLFEKSAVKAPGMIVRMNAAIPCRDAFPTLPGEFEILQTQPHKLVSGFSAPEREAISAANLLILFGHGVPGMTCSLDVGTFNQVDMRNKIVLCGSCFSAAPRFSGLPPVDVGIDGSPVRQERQRFSEQALGGGALAFYGHMRENGGFPELSALLETLIKGGSLGEGFQRLTNVNLIMSEVPTERIVIPPTLRTNKQALSKHTELLYVLIGDPAICPYPGGVSSQ